MKNLGHFDDKALELFKANFSESTEFSEKDEAYDFARCQRPDGSIYGTSGQCRKGTPTSDKAPEKKAANGGKARAQAKASGEVADRRAAARKENEAKKVLTPRTDSKMTSERAAQVKAAFDRKRSAVSAPDTKSGNTRATKTTTAMSPADRKRAESASAARKVAAEMTPKVKEADKRAKDLNKQAERLDRAYQKQNKITQKSPTKENKDRLKLIQRETRMADRAAKKADREAEKLDRELIRMRKAADKEKGQSKNVKLNNTPQDGPKATAGQRQSAMKALRQERSRLENMEDEGKLSKAGESRLKLVKASQREYEIEGKQRMKRQTR